MKGKRLGWVVMLIVFAAVIGVSAGRMSATSVSAAGEGYEELKTFTEVLSMIKKYYVEDVKTKDLVYSAIKGMLGSLDPHSSFMPPEAYKEMQVETKGEFGGLGIQIGMKDKVLTVIAPIEDTPADKAGIKAGDKIVKINKESTEDMTLQDAVSKMRGAPKTAVTIGILREGWKEPKDFTIVRDVIKIKSVKSKVLEGGIGYIKISQFQEMTASDLAGALKNLEDKKVNSMVLDLRNNPGGLLNSAIDVSSQFLPKGKLVVYTKTRSGEKSEFFTDGETYFAKPMIVLVNQGSASASEIVAGALKDWNRAAILGTQTFGKGSVQTVIPLSDGAGLRLTTAKYYTPKGISIQNTGITPDIVMKLEAKNGEKEHPVLRERDLARHLKNEQAPAKPEDVEMAPLEVDEKDDVQLQRAVDILKTWNIFKDIPKAPAEDKVHGAKGKEQGTKGKE
ncbi:MAG: S41 family peptidase [Nitrospiraceae bacterium]|nr:S41 family peptidase [Nitrospiraceae bacterium]